VDFSPAFIWLLRDFQLRLESNGRQISPAEYLEEALLPVKGGEADIANRNQVGAAKTALFAWDSAESAGAVGKHVCVCGQDAYAVVFAVVAVQWRLPLPAALLRSTSAPTPLLLSVPAAQMRTTIKTVFPDRDVATLVRPALSEAHLQRLDTLPVSSLRPEFRRVRQVA
jgi:hypothetical protein